MNAKHQAFVREVVVDGNATRAYKKVYKCTDAVAAANGSRLLKNASVSQAIAESQAKATTRAELTLQSHLETLQALRDEARAANQYSAATKAEELRGKVSGLYVERVEHSGAVDLSKTERESAVLTILTTARKRQKEMVS